MSNISNLNLALLNLEVDVETYNFTVHLLIADHNSNCFDSFIEEATAAYLNSEGQPKRFGGYFTPEQDAFVSVERITPLDLSTYLKFRDVLEVFESEEALAILGKAPKALEAD